AGKNVSVDQFRASADRFEDNILPLNRKLFGTEAEKGYDGDPRITVLMANVPGAGGYFSAADNYPKAVNPHSNERKLILVDLAYRPGTRGFESTLAHEYQHMIHQNVRPGDQVWIDEGFSTTAEMLNGFGIGGYPNFFFSKPGIQLNAWAEDAARNPGPYGAAFSWTNYFFPHYGGYDGMRDYLAIRDTDRKSFDRYLEQLGRTERFDDVFADWVVANLINDKSLADGR